MVDSGQVRCRGEEGGRGREGGQGEGKMEGGGFGAERVNDFLPWCRAVGGDGGVWWVMVRAEARGADGKSTEIRGQRGRAGIGTPRAPQDGRYHMGMTTRMDEARSHAAPLKVGAGVDRHGERRRMGRVGRRCHVVGIEARMEEADAGGSKAGVGGGDMEGERRRRPGEDGKAAIGQFRAARRDHENAQNGPRLPR